MPQESRFPIVSSNVSRSLKFVCMYVYVSGCSRAFHPKVFDPIERAGKGGACLGARIGLDQLNVDSSQSANSQTPVLNLSVDLVSFYNFNVAFHAPIDIAIQFARTDSSGLLLPSPVLWASYTLRLNFTYGDQPFVFQVTIRYIRRD